MKIDASDASVERGASSVARGHICAVSGDRIERRMDRFFDAARGAHGGAARAEGNSPRGAARNGHPSLAFAHFFALQKRLHCKVTSQNVMTSPPAFAPVRHDPCLAPCAAPAHN